MRPFRHIDLPEFLSDPHSIPPTCGFSSCPPTACVIAVRGASGCEIAALACICACVLGLFALGARTAPLTRMHSTDGRGGGT
jgi:hypothetical protein